MNNNLYPNRHPQTELFLVDIFQSFKDDIASMEHPIFSLSKKPDFRIPEYSHNNKSIKIREKNVRFLHILDICGLK
mgnify:CR=1 FL=1